MTPASHRQSVTCEAAAAVVEACVEQARRQGLKICAAVVDSSGILTAFLRMPGAPFHSADIAIDKAYTAASFGVPTGTLGEVMKHHSAAVQAGVPLRPRVILFGGGLPLEVNGECIGAVGVSGASEDEDVQCAQYGRTALSASGPA
jgi:uncharacterized protein GlcG (DUF336 family)